MTSVVGIFCRDGVVIGADSSATFIAGQQRTIEQPTEKLWVVADNVIVAGSGYIGLDQRFHAIVEKAWDEHVFQKTPLEAAKWLTATAIQDFVSTSAPKGHYQALVAFPYQHKPQLCEWDINTFQPELKTERLWYCSIGSAQPITDPFLALMRDILWEHGCPGLHDGIFATTWALEHAVMVNPGGVNAPIRLAVLEHGPKGLLQARVLDDDELGEHRQNIKEAKRLLRDYRDRHRAPRMEEAPDIPQP